MGRQYIHPADLIEGSCYAYNPYVRPRYIKVIKHHDGYSYRVLTVGWYTDILPRVEIEEITFNAMDDIVPINEEYFGQNYNEAIQLLNDALNGQYLNKLQDNGNRTGEDTER